MTGRRLETEHPWSPEGFMSAPEGKPLAQKPGGNRERGLMLLEVSHSFPVLANTVEIPVSAI